VGSHEAPRAVGRPGISRVAAGGLALLACILGAAAWVRTVTWPAWYAPEGRLAWMLSLGLPGQARHVLIHAVHAVAIAGLAVVATGLFRKSPRVLLAGIGAQLPLLVLRALSVPAYAMFIARPSALGLMYPASTPFTDEYSFIRWVSAADTALTLIYGAYLLWLRRELRRMGPGRAHQEPSATRRYSMTTCRLVATALPNGVGPMVAATV
jgi:hypothetical protein